MQGVALNLGEGNFEYQVDMERYADGVRMRSSGTLSLTPPVATRNVTPAMPLSNGAVVNNGVVGYLWSQPAWDRKPLYRYYSCAATATTSPRPTPTWLPNSTPSSPTTRPRATHPAS